MFHLNRIKVFSSRVQKSLNSRYKTFQVNQRARLKHYRSQLIDLGNPQAVIWIFGCQRSGTTFLETIFRHDLDSVVFGEFSELTLSENKTVLSEPERIQKIVQSKNACYAVIRPLFESDRALELMNLFPNSIGVWLFRDCPHVVDSMIRKWEDRFFEVSKQNESDERGMWRLEQAIESIYVAAQSALPEDPTMEAYARYWLFRNQIPFHAGLQQDPRVVFLSYRQLVLTPRMQVERIMKRAGMADVWKDFKVNAFTSSIDRPVQLNISEETVAHCDQIYQQLVNHSTIDRQV
jgi:hypothetical protein